MKNEQASITNPLVAVGPRIRASPLWNKSIPEMQHNLGMLTCGNLEEYLKTKNADDHTQDELEFHAALREALTNSRIFNYTHC